MKNKINKRVITAIFSTLIIFSSQSYASLFELSTMDCKNPNGCALNSKTSNQVLQSINNEYKNTFNISNNTGTLSSAHRERFSGVNNGTTRTVLGNAINCGALFDRNGNTKYSVISNGGNVYFVYDFIDFENMIEIVDVEKIYNHSGVDISIATQLNLNINERTLNDDEVKTLKSSWNKDGFIYGRPEIQRNSSTNLIIPAFFCDRRIPESIINDLAQNSFKFCSDIPNNQITNEKVFSDLYKDRIDVGTNGGSFYESDSNFDTSVILDRMSGSDYQRVRDIFTENEHGYCIPDKYTAINGSNLDMYCDISSRTVRNDNFGGLKLLATYLNVDNLSSEILSIIRNNNCSGIPDSRLRAGEERKILVGTNSDLFYGHMTFQCNRNSNGSLSLVTLDNEGNNCTPNTDNFFSSQQGIPNCGEDLCMFTGSLACTDKTVMWGDNNQCWADLSFSYSQVPTSGNARILFSESEAEGQAAFHCIEGDWRISGMNGQATCGN